MNFTPSAASILKAARAEQGFTQKTLAEAMGVSASMVQQVEIGNRNFSLDLARRAAQVLHLDDDTADALFSHSQPEHEPPEAVTQRVDDLERELAALRAEIDGLRDDFRSFVEALSADGSHRAATRRAHAATER